MTRSSSSVEFLAQLEQESQGCLALTVLLHHQSAGWQLLASLRAKRFLDHSLQWVPSKILALWASPSHSCCWALVQEELPSRSPCFAGKILLCSKLTYKCESLLDKLAFQTVYYGHGGDYCINQCSCQWPQAWPFSRPGFKVMLEWVQRRQKYTFGEWERHVSETLQSQQWDPCRL